jgi:microcystin-dependent protein
MQTNLYYSANNNTLTTGNIYTSGATGNTFNGDTTFYNKVNVPTPTTSNTNEVVNTSYLTGVLNNYAPINNGNPTGTIITFSVQTSSLSGYLLCDGSTYSPTTYSALYAVIGTQFGGTASAPWLPDYRGSFLRGFNDASGNNNRGVAGDPYYKSGNIGVIQTEQVGSHTHGNPHSGQKYGGTSTSLHYPAVGNTQDFIIGTNQFSANVDYNIPSGENRPVNFSIYYYIKT